MSVGKGRSPARSSRAELFDPPDPLGVLWLAMAGITAAFIGAVLVAADALPTEVAAWAIAGAVPARFVVGFADLRRTADAVAVLAAAALVVRLAVAVLR